MNWAIRNCFDRLITLLGLLTGRVLFSRVQVQCLSVTVVEQRSGTIKGINGHGLGDEALLGPFELNFEIIRTIDELNFCKEFVKSSFSEVLQ